MTSPQFRIIGDTLYRRANDPYAYDLKIHDLGHGQVEALSIPRHAWHEVGQCTQQALEDAMVSADHIRVEGEWVKQGPTQQELLDRAAMNRERSARRARTQVRRLVKHMNLDTMLTLTYRENMQDRGRMARDLDVFIKRIRRVLPAFQYVCVFERQKRGAWHAHLAVARVQSHYVHKGVLVKSYDLLRAIWRAVVGEGNVDVSRSLRKGQRNVRKLSGYLSKYIAKGFSEGQEGDSYRASGRALPKPVVLRSLTADPSQAARELYEFLRAFWPGARMHSALLDGGAFFVALSP